MTPPDEMHPIKLDPVGVVGLGLLGRGIAASLLSAGLHVIAIDTQEKAQQEARIYIEAAMLEVAKHGGAPSQGLDSWGERYKASSSMHALETCAFVIESVLEDIDVKHKVFDEIESIIGEQVPIASNTSALPITALQGGRKHPARFLGMHWSEPAYSTRFLEIIRGRQTSHTALQSAMKLGLMIGKDPCIVEQDIPGFIANRLAYALYREAAYLLELGVGDVATIDRAFRNAFGLWATFCGPFRWIDLAGGPALYAKVMDGIIQTLNNSPKLPAIFAEKQSEGERGVIDGRGFYTYESGDAEKWQKLLHEHAWEIRHLQERYYPLSTTDREKE